MSEEAEPNIDVSTPPPPREGPGATLRDARETAGMTVEEVARSLNLEKGIVHALESDDVERLPEPAYVKGYLRAYARLLELNANELIEAYTGLEVPQHEVLPLEPAPVTIDQRVRLQVVGGVVVLVLIVLSAWWFTRPKPTPALTHSPAIVQHGANATVKAGARTATGSTAATGSVPLVEPTVSGGRPSASNGAAPSAPVTPASKSASNARSASAPSAAANNLSATSGNRAPASAAAGSQTRLVLQLTAKSWVQISDAAGKTLYRGLLDAGTHKTLFGQAPFDVFLGYAPGVDLHVAGKNVSAVQYALGNNTARFVVSADGKTHR